MKDQVSIYWTLQEAGDNLLGLLSSSPEDLLSTEEHRLFQQMKVEKRKTEWLMGRLTMKALLTADRQPLSGAPFPSITIANHVEGAPFISQPHTEGCISISHREKIALCAFTSAPATNLGIDLEMIEPRQMAFVEDFFTQNEADYTRQLEGCTRDIWTTLVWSAKEAILKAWQKGLRLDTRTIDIFPIDPGNLKNPSTGWQPIQWKANIEGFPQCWLGWRRWNNFVITLACTLQKDNPQETPGEIHQIQLGQLPKLS